MSKFLSLIYHTTELDSLGLAELKLSLCKEAKVGSTALVFNVLKKVPKMDGRVDLNNPVLSVVVTVTFDVVDIDPSSVVVDGGVMVVLLDSVVVALTISFSLELGKVVMLFFAKEMAPFVLTTKCGLRVVTTFLLCLNPTDFLPRAPAILALAAASMLDLTRGFSPSGLTSGPSSS